MSSGIPLYFILCYATRGTCWNMHLNYQQYLMVSLTRMQKNEMSYKSAIRWYIRLKFSMLIHLDVFYNIKFVFFHKPKTYKKIHIFFICQIIFFSFFFLDPRGESSSVVLFISRHFMQINLLKLQKLCPKERLLWTLLLHPNHPDMTSLWRQPVVGPNFFIFTHWVQTWWPKRNWKFRIDCTFV